MNNAFGIQHQHFTHLSTRCSYIFLQSGRSRKRSTSSLLAGHWPIEKKKEEMVEAEPINSRWPKWTKVFIGADQEIWHRQRKTQLKKEKKKWIEATNSLCNQITHGPAGSTALCISQLLAIVRWDSECRTLLVGHRQTSCWAEDLLCWHNICKDQGRGQCDREGVHKCGIQQCIVEKMEQKGKLICRDMAFGRDAHPYVIASNCFHPRATIPCHSTAAPKKKGEYGLPAYIWELSMYVYDCANVRTRKRTTTAIALIRERRWINSLAIEWIFDVPFASVCVRQCVWIHSFHLKFYTSYWQSIQAWPNRFEERRYTIPFCWLLSLSPSSTILANPKKVRIRSARNRNPRKSKTEK